MALPKNYKPTISERYMCPEHLEYFREALLKWREELLKDSIESLHQMQEESPNESDLTDRATQETDRTIELRTRDRERKLVHKINQALERIDDGTYGFCEETGVPIGLPRLEARPIATLCVEAQERHERLEKTHREDE